MSISKTSDEWAREATLSDLVQMGPLPSFGLSMRDVAHLMERTFRELTPTQLIYRNAPRFEWTERTPSNPWPYTWDHYHDLVELAIPLYGGVRLRLGTKQCALEPGHVAFVAPGDLHSELPADADGPYRLCWIRTKPRVAFLWISEYRPNFRPPFAVSVRRRIAGVDDDLIIRALMELNDHPLRCEDAIVAYLKAFYFTLMQSLEHQSTGTSTTVEAIRHLVEKRYQEDISVRQIATELQMNPSYICSIFKRQTGKTIGEYITMVRIRRALSVLQFTDVSIQQVAKECGYSDPYRFSKVFHSETGITPTGYRKEVRRIPYLAE